MKSHFGKAVDELEFEYELTNDNTVAKANEALQLKLYLIMYGELPPLNHQLPKYPK